MTTTKATPDVEVGKKETKGEKLVNAEREKERIEKKARKSVLHPNAQRNARLFLRGIRSMSLSTANFSCKTVVFAFANENDSGSLGLSLSKMLDN